MCFFVSDSSDVLDILEKAIITAETVDDWPCWHSLGLALDLEKYRLDLIHIDHRGNVRDCLKAMLSLWLDTGNASWRALVRALASPLVGKRYLAEKIAAEHSKCEEHVVCFDNFIHMFDITCDTLIILT